MGYRIEYRNHGKVHIQKRIRKPIPKWWIGAACAVLILAVMVIVWQNGYVRNLLIPGDPEVTAHALQELVDALCGGEGLGDSITAFCIEVIENAKTAR